MVFSFLLSLVFALRLLDNREHKKAKVGKNIFSCSLGHFYKYFAGKLLKISKTVLFTPPSQRRTLYYKMHFLP